MAVVSAAKKSEARYKRFKEDEDEEDEACVDDDIFEREGRTGGNH